MNAKEWPLLVFTLVMQLSVGMVLIYDLFLLFPLYRTRVEIPARFQWILVMALAAAIAGIFVSFMHLGHPMNAARTLANLSESWLSREILCLLVFTGLLFLATLLHFLYPASGRSLKWLVDLTALTGIILIYSMSRIYMIPSQPVWNHLFTPIGFYLTTVAFGSAILLLFQINSGSWASQKALSVLTISAIACLIIMIPVFLTWIEIAGSSSGLTLAVLLRDNMTWFYLRMIFLLVAAGCSVWTMLTIRSAMVHNGYLFVPAILTLMAVIASQVLDRFLFYAQNHSGQGF